MSADKSVVGRRLRGAREAPPRWSRAEMARKLRAAADPSTREYLPHVENLGHMIKEWEAGKHGVSERYQELYARALETTVKSLFDAPRRFIPDLSDLNGRPGDAEYVESIRETNQALVRLDTLHGGDEIFPLALRLFRAAHQKLGDGSYEPAVERDLIAATGETGEIAAWLAYDADSQAESRQLIHEALMLSRQAGDRNLELFELGHLAMQAIYLNRPAEGLRIADDVLDMGHRSPRVAALFEIRRGRALAQLGSESEALNALDKARTELAHGIGPWDPYWTWWVTDVEVTWHEGMSRAELANWGESIEPFENTVRRRATYRRARYNDLAHLLNALVHVRDWRRAEEAITELAGLTGSIGSGRTVNLLRRIAERISRSGDAPSTVADAAENLRRGVIDPGRGAICG